MLQCIWEMDAEALAKISMATAADHITMQHKLGVIANMTDKLTTQATTIARLENNYSDTTTTLNEDHRYHWDRKWQQDVERQQDVDR